MRTKAILIVVAVIGLCIFAPLVGAETAEEWNELGTSAASSGDFEKAIECNDKPIELDPGYAKAYYNRGAVYDRLEEYEKALEDYDMAIALDVEVAERAHYNRALVVSKLDEQNAREERTSVPGFEAVFAIAGLLAVISLVRRRN